MSDSAYKPSGPIVLKPPKQLVIAGCTWMGTWAVNTGTPRCILIEAPSEYVAEVVRRYNAYDTQETLLREMAEWFDYDAKASRFYRETGIMAPGKDAPAAAPETRTMEERESAWREWLDKRRASLVAGIESTLTSKTEYYTPETPSPGSNPNCKHAIRIMCLVAHDPPRRCERCTECGQEFTG